MIPSPRLFEQFSLNELQMPKMWHLRCIVTRQVAQKPAPQKHQVFGHVFHLHPGNCQTHMTDDCVPTWEQQGVTPQDAPEAHAATLCVPRLISAHALSSEVEGHRTPRYTLDMGCHLASGHGFVCFVTSFGKRSIRQSSLVSLFASERGM